MPRLSPGGLEDHEGQKGKRGGVGSTGDQLAEGGLGVGPAGTTPAEYLDEMEKEARELGYDVIIGHEDLFAIAFNTKFVNVGFVIGLINDLIEDSGMQIDPNLDGQIHDPITNLKLDLSADTNAINIPYPTNFAIFILGNKMEFTEHMIKGTEGLTVDGKPTSYQRVFAAAIFYSIAAVFGPKIIIQVFKRFLIPFVAGTGARRYKRKVLEGINDTNILISQIAEDVLDILDKIGGVDEKDLRLIRKLKLFTREV